MKVLLTSSGITNDTIRASLARLLGKPIEDANALIIGSGMWPFSVGPVMVARLIRGEVNAPMSELGWKSLGVLEPSVLPSISRDAWVPAVQAADAILVWGGDPLFLAYWLEESGLSEVLASLPDAVYVGVSAGAMAATTVIGETYTEPRDAAGTALASEDLVLEGGVERTLVTAAGIGLVEFSVIPHYLNDNHPDASAVNAAIWAGKVAAPTYAIDEQTAIAVVDGEIDVVSEGQWKLFAPR